MTEQSQTTEIEIEEDAVVPTDELSLLKARADQMGIPYKSNIGVDTLRAKITAKLNDEPAPSEAEEAVQPATPQAAVQPARPAEPVERPKTRTQIEQETRDRMYREEMALVRCQIANLDPSKNDWSGIFVTVANKYLGTVTKFIPFGEAAESYHIPRCIFKELKNRKYQQIRVKKDKNGIETPDCRLVPSFNLVELPPLTQEELAELGLAQAAAERVGV